MKPLNIVAALMSASLALLPLLLPHLSEHVLYVLGTVCVLIFHVSGQVLQMLQPSIKANGGDVAKAVLPPLAMLAMAFGMMGCSAAMRQREALVEYQLVRDCAELDRDYTNEPATIRVVCAVGDTVAAFTLPLEAWRSANGITVVDAGASQ